MSKYAQQPIKKNLEICFDNRANPNSMEVCKLICKQPTACSSCCFAKLPFNFDT